MNDNTRKQIENDLKQSLQNMGIGWSKLEMTSAAKEIALLDQIEINYPSREVKNVIPVEYPNPNKIGEFIRAEVEHTSRVVMTDEEVAAYRKQQDEDRMLEMYANDPDRFFALLDKLPNKGKKPVVKKPPAGRKSK